MDESKRINAKFDKSYLIGEAEFCVRCGNPLKGRTHCPLCGYRNLFSHYESTSPELSFLAKWLSTRRGGIDPLGNALIALIMTCAGLSLLLGIFSYAAASEFNGSFSRYRFEIFSGFWSGVAISPFIFMPIYLKVKKEILEQRKIPKSDSVSFHIRTHILVGGIIIFSMIAAIFINEPPFEVGFIILAVIILFYLSLATVGFSSLLFIGSWSSENSEWVWIGIFVLIAS